MGNRAILLPEGETTGVYLSWNGGPDSVTAFLEYCKLKKCRDFGGKNRDSYGMARFIQIVSNFFGGTDSIGIVTNISTGEENASHYDNGIYVISGWDIKERIGSISGKENYCLEEMLLLIDEAQPVKEQLGRDFLLAKKVDASSLKIKDKVFTQDFTGKPSLCTVKGIFLRTPYVDLYSKINGDFFYNPNNLLKGKVRLLRSKEEQEEFIAKNFKPTGGI